MELEVKLSQADLLRIGFVRYKDTFSKSQDCFQLRVRDERGTKYFINCKYYDWKSFSNLEFSASFEFDAQFTKGNNTFNILLLSRQERSIEEVLEFFQDMFVKMELDYYDEHY